MGIGSLPKRRFPCRPAPFISRAIKGHGMVTKIYNYCKHGLIAGTCYHCQGINNEFVRNVRYQTTPPQKTYSFTAFPNTPKKITHRWKGKEILSFINADIFNRPGIRGGSSIVTRYNFKDRPPSFLIEGRPFDPDPFIYKRLPIKGCSTCKDRSVCKKLCDINEKYVSQPTARKRTDTSLLHGALLEDIGNEAVSSWQEMSRLSLTLPTTFDFLTQRENQVIQYWNQGKTYKEIATALSGGRARVSITTRQVAYHVRAVKKKIRKNTQYEKPKRYVKRLPPLPFNRIPKIDRVPKSIEKKISKIDKTYGTDLRWWYENRVKGREYPLESLLTMSQEFWKKPSPKITARINNRTGRCYYPEDDIFRIIAPIDNKAWKPTPTADESYGFKYDYGGEDTANLTIEGRTESDKQREITEIIK